jgi:hypothetical protein
MLIQGALKLWVANRQGLVTYSKRGHRFLKNVNINIHIYIKAQFSEVFEIQYNTPAAKEIF